MSFDLKIENRGIYLHVRIVFFQCIQNFKEVWSRIGRECGKQASRRVLCECGLVLLGRILDLA